MALSPNWNVQKINDKIGSSVSGILVSIKPSRLKFLVFKIRKLG